MATLTGILHMLKPEVPGATDEVLFHGLSEAAREFCRRSMAWRASTEAIPVTAGETDYALDLDIDTDNTDNYEIIRITSAEIDDVALVAGSGYVLLDSETIRLLTEPAQDSETGLVVECVVMPGVLKDFIDDDVLARYRHVIAAGARFFMYRQFGKPWTDRNQAAYWKSEFDSGVTSAMYDTERGRGTVGEAMVELRRMF
jgi:hypothetical protein